MRDRRRRLLGLLRVPGPDDRPLNRAFRPDAVPAQTVTPEFYPSLDCVHSGAVLPRHPTPGCDMVLAQTQCLACVLALAAAGAARASRPASRIVAPVRLRSR
ncbi:MAG: hypothetical protein B7Y47_07135 [Sphingomonas sp. 28-63-12]|nr:MAG: hypothetical protein B7Y47_07135 [Sphingomonas sp. 28-63-12]